MTIALSASLSLLTATAATTAREDAAQKRRDDRLKETRAAVETLKQSRVDPAESRKAAAMQKVARIKEQIRVLRMMASSEPKQVARLVAQLARELGAAVKEYAAAGGDASALGPAPAAASG